MSPITVSGGGFPARFPGTCQSCGRSFQTGVAIERAERVIKRRSAYRHVECAPTMPPLRIDGPRATALQQALGDSLRSLSQLPPGSPSLPPGLHVVATTATLRDDDTSRLTVPDGHDGTYLVEAHAIVETNETRLARNGRTESIVRGFGDGYHLHRVVLHLNPGDIIDVIPSGIITARRLDAETRPGPDAVADYLGRQNVIRDSVTRAWRNDADPLPSRREGDEIVTPYRVRVRWKHPAEYPHGEVFWGFRQAVPATLGIVSEIHPESSWDDERGQLWRVTVARRWDM